MAMCNLIAFVVFTLWPCMPPRLLSDPNYDGPDAEQAKSYGFVDTVHGTEGESSVWTTNRFCNQYGGSSLKKSFFLYAQVLSWFFLFFLFPWDWVLHPSPALGGCMFVVQLVLGMYSRPA